MSRPTGDWKGKTTVMGKTLGRAQGPTKVGNVPLATSKFFDGRGIRKPDVRSSALACLEECPRKFLYTYRFGLRPKGYESALTLGSLCHTVMQNLFLGKTEAEAVQAAVASRVVEEERLAGAANDAGFVGGKDLTALLKQLQEDCHKACAMAVTLWRMRPFDTERWQVLRDPTGEPLVESKFKVKWPGLTRPIVCKPDLVLEDTNIEEGPSLTLPDFPGGSRRAWIVDYKTTGTSPRVVANATLLSPQMQIYRLALKVTLDHWHKQGLAPQSEIVGSIHVIMLKPGIKFLPDKESWEEHIQRLIKWYEDKEAKDPQNPPIVLDFDRFGPRYMPTELHGRLKQFCRAAHSAPDVDRFYRGGGSTCTKFNKSCPYLPLCVANPASWPSLVQEHYDTRFREDEET